MPFPPTDVVKSQRKGRPFCKAINDCPSDPVDKMIERFSRLCKNACQSARAEKRPSADAACPYEIRLPVRCIDLRNHDAVSIRSMGELPIAEVNAHMAFFYRDTIEYEISGHKLKKINRTSFPDQEISRSRQIHAKKILINADHES